MHRVVRPLALTRLGEGRSFSSCVSLLSGLFVAGSLGECLRVGLCLARLEGPLRWAVDVGSGASVAIAGPLPPPS